MDAKGSVLNRAELGGRSAKAESPQAKDFNHVKEVVPEPNFRLHPLKTHDSIGLQVTW